MLSLALMGAKATFIPVIGAGILLVASVELVRHRRLPRTALGLGVVLAVELAFAQVVLFGGASQGMALAPGADLRRLSVTLGIPAETGTLPPRVRAARSGDPRGRLRGRCRGLDGRLLLVT